MFGVEAAQGRVQYELSRFIGPEGAAVVQEIVAASARPKTNRITAAIGLVTLLVSATGALMQLQESLNTIWEVTPKPGLLPEGPAQEAAASASSSSSAWGRS